MTIDVKIEGEKKAIVIRFHFEFELKYSFERKPGKQRSQIGTK